ncbi:glycerophosphoryl diester phosphodiesterase [Bryobacterales bacterium F-183]|nr:glycerophosphoryl diester phosphodiesterase [Bryobacterales bacterium F-183]
MPENTIPAFEYAIQAGADVLELDLAVTKDDVLVVSHDSFLHAPTCKGPVEKAAIRELTLAEVRKWDCGVVPNPQFPGQKRIPGTRMPTLDEVFGLAKKGKFEFNVETKISPARPELSATPERFAELLAQAIVKHKLVSRVIVQSFDYRTLVAMRKINPEIRLSALFTNSTESYAAISRKAGNAEFVSPIYTGVTAAQVKAAQAEGLNVVPWTPNTTAEWDRLIEMGVDAIITDDPAALIVHLQKRGLRKR